MAPSGAILRPSLILLVAIGLGARAAAADVVAAAGPLPIVPSGTPVADRSAARWNRLILAAAPRIAAGDVESIPLGVRERLGRLTLVLMATVRAVAGAGGGPRHELDDLGAGYALPVAGRLTVVDTEHPPPEAGLDFLGRQILSQNGKSLVGLHCVGATDTMRVFDAESILFRDGRHGDFVMRHFVWVDPASGECSACVWLLAKRSDGGLDVVEDPPRWIASGTHEDRAIHVDANEFMLGIPTRRSFALLDLPPGKPLRWSPALKAAAASQAWPAATVASLAHEIDRGLAPLRAGPAPVAPR